MPSLWRKKGNRISRLVSDLQTTPKRGGSLVVETGFPTSLVDLFVKNRDKLKKHKSKKSKSKEHHSKIPENDYDDDVVVYDDDNDADDDKSISQVPSVSYSSESLSDLEVPRCSILGKCQKNDSVVDDNIVVTHEKLHHDSCKNDASVNDEKRESLDVTNEKNMVLFSILVGLLVLIVVLYTKRWFLAFVTLGFLLLLLLEYVGNPVIKLSKPCENEVSMSVLKGGLAVVVALYTKWFVVGITMGASLLLLLEYAGNSGFGWFKPCNDATWTLQGFLSKWGAIKRNRTVGVRDERRRGRGVLKRSANIGSRKEGLKKGEKEVVSRGDFGQGGVGDGVASRKEIEPEFGNNLSLKKGSDESLVEDGEVTASKGVVEQGSRCSTYVNDNSWLLDEDSRNKPIHELLALELNGSKKSRSSYGSGSVEYIDLQGEKGAIGGGVGEEGYEDTKTGKHKGKGKKGKKFWKRLVPKKKSKKNKHKHEKAYDASNIDGSIHDTEADLDEEDEVEEVEQEISEVEGSSTLSSYDQDDVGSDNRASDSSCIEMLELDNNTTSTCGMIKEQCGSPKYVAIMMIPLAGLIGGRMCAVALTVICCLMFKMVRG